MSDPLRLTSRQIRDMAEYAESVRGTGGKAVFFVAQPDELAGGVVIVCQEDAPDPSPESVVVPASTASVQPNREPVKEVTILTASLNQPESLAQYDAVFWTEAAVEKFLFPYYASKAQWEAAHVMSSLAQAFYGFVPGEGGSQTVEGDIPFAVAHLPRSDYVPLDNPPVPSSYGSVGRDVALLFKQPDGTVRHRLLAEFL